MRVRGSVRQIKGCDSHGLQNNCNYWIDLSTCTSFRTYMILHLEVQVHWSEWCSCASPEDSVVVPSSQPLLERTSTDMNM